MSQERATARDVILAVAENMKSSLEPLVTKTLAPSLYQVYLHGEDYERLRTIFGEIEAEAKELLDREMQRTQSFTGIEGIHVQDQCVTESMGAIVDRSLEHLAPSDIATPIVEGTVSGLRG